MPTIFLTHSIRASWAVSLALATMLVATSSAHAADADTGALYSDGPYAALLGHYDYSDDSARDKGLGGTVAGGVRRGPIALELGGGYTRGHSANALGGSLNGLLFPFDSLPGLFGLIGVGAKNIGSYPGAGGDHFNVTTVDGGIGYLFPLQFGDSHFGLRAQVVYEYGKRQPRSQEQDAQQEHLPAPSNTNDVIASIGLVFPFGRPPLPPPAPEPAAVVPVGDSDGDGVTDDIDQCPNTPAGTKVDAKGCPLPPPCKTPEASERVSLAGCGTGDSIVLRGVNFEFDQSRLTANAKTILDGVGDELKAYPEIKIELGGYTDAKGSDEYNQHLSEQRAAAVVTYLESLGVAADRMTSAGYGENNPIADNDSDEGRELNRRVELKITDRTAPAVPKAAEPATAPASDPAVPAPPGPTATTATPADASVP